MNPKTKGRVVLLSIVCVVVVVVAVFAVLETQPAKPEPPRAYTQHPAIVINGNSDFTASNGVVSGTGSSGNPYIIEGWAIGFANTSRCIAVYDADVHFTIRHVHTDHGLSGISLVNVTHARVEHCVVDNSSSGINVIESKSIAILSNTVRGCMIGINILSSNSVRLDDNYFLNNGQNVKRPSIPWEQSWIGDAICIAILIPLFILIGLAVYLRLTRKPGMPQETQIQLEGQEQKPPVQEGTQKR